MNRVEPNLDVVTIGETMVLMTPEQGMPLDYVSSFQKQLGGAESNFAIALSRLGHRCGWISQLGNDPFGRFIHRTIRGEGVDTQLVTFNDAFSTGLFFKEKRYGDHMNVYYYRNDSAASRMNKSILSESYISSANYLFLTGITPALSSECEEMILESINIAQKHQIPIVFDPNIRRKLWGSSQKARETLNYIASQADFILPGIDEGRYLTGKDTPLEIASYYLEKNPTSTIIIKLGKEGAYYATSEKEGYVTGYPVKNIIDPTGAGDGFAAGFMSGLLLNYPIEQSLDLGNLVGAIIVQTSGDVEGYPRFDELEKIAQDMKNPGNEEVQR